MLLFPENTIPSVISFLCSKCKLTKPELVFCSLAENHFDTLWKNVSSP